MNTLAIQRIAWKEFRQQRMFFVAMGIVALLVFFLVSVLPGITDNRFDPAYRWPAMIIGLFSALHAAGCGATLFALEKEERTFLNLQILPITSRQLITGKLSVAVVICFIVCTVTFIAVGLSGSLDSDPWLGPDGSWVGAWLKTFGLATVEFFAWSLLFSLLLNNPLVAATLGIAVASSTIQTFALLTYASEPFVMESYVAAFWPRCLLIAMVLVADFWIASRWLNGMPVRKSERRQLFGKRIRERAVAEPVAAQPTRRRIFGRFFWQALRCSWPLMLVYVLCLPLCLPFGLSTGRIEIAMGILMFVAAVAGVFAFSFDKTSGGVAFLSHHGERPGLYWLANVLLWIGWIVLVNLVVGLVIVTVSSLQEPSSFTTHGRFAFYRNNIFNELSSEMGILFSTILSAVWLTCGMILSFAAGHLCSLLVERRILATMAAMVVCVPVTIWYVLMLASETPLTWSVLPLFIALMGGGCLSARWWIGNRRNLFRVTALLGSILLLWTSLAWLVAQKRSTEIPVVQFDIAEYRQELGEPDAKILAEMQSRFAAALDGYEFPKNIYPSLPDRYPEILSALRDGNTGPLNERVSKSLRDDLHEFVQRTSSYSPVKLRDRAASEYGQNVETQIELTNQHLEENRQRLNQLADAIQFAAAHVDEIRRMEPFFHRKTINPGEPDLPLRYKEDTWRTILELDFLDTVRRGNSREAWQRLKALWLIDSIHRLIYARSAGWDYVASFMDIWIEMEGLDRIDVMEALDLAKEGWLNPNSRQRELERSYLAISQAIQVIGLYYEGKTWGSREMKQNLFRAQLFDWFPWERSRSMRLVNLWTAYQLALPKDLLDYDEGTTYLVHLATTNGNAVVPKFGEWVDNTILPSHQDGQSLTGLQRQSPRNQKPDHSTNWRYPAIRAEEFAEIQTLKLAAVAWQLTHDSMPENLQQLEGPVFGLTIPTVRGEIDSEGHEVRVPKYELIPEHAGPGDRFIVHAESEPGWTSVNLSLARVPFVVDTGRTQQE